MAESRAELSPFLERLDLDKLAKHNKGYLSYAKDPIGLFIDAESHTHTRVVDYLYKNLPAKATILDIGFFIPIVPITLSKLGFQVCSIENLAFYDRALDDIISYVSKSYRIDVLDIDIVNDDIGEDDRFDAVILSAILEHLNGTPKTIITRAQALGKENANYLFAVPNVAAIGKRISLLLKGSPPFPPISDYYHSAYPFTGHNREYTISDLKYILTQSGFEILHLETYNRPIKSGVPIKVWLLNILARIGPESFQESILAVSRRIHHNDPK
jgi:hypothetical protein